MYSVGAAALCVVRVVHRMPCVCSTTVVMQLGGRYQFAVETVGSCLAVALRALIPDLHTELQGRFIHDVNQFVIHGVHSHVACFEGVYMQDDSYRYKVQEP